MQSGVELNRARWDEATRLHLRGNVYGVEDFKAGLCRLHRVEKEELGDVSGRSLLHLQCHFGLDTLSWARRGATVTGVDFSPEGIAAARALSAETGVPGRFICSDLYKLSEQLSERFDLIYTSYGVLNWLPTLKPWGESIARHLEPGGTFYIVEAHPTARMFPTEEDVAKHTPGKPFISYFHDPEGIRWPAGPDYADPNAMHEHGAHEWQHSLSDIVSALLEAGLVLEHLHEFPYCSWEVVAGTHRIESFSDGHGYYGLPASEPQLPLMFSIKARKPR